MTTKTREQQRDDLLEQLYFLVAPIKQILEDEDDWRPKIKHLRAVFRPQGSALEIPLRDFGIIRGIRYEAETNRVSSFVGQIGSFLDRLESTSSDPSTRRSCCDEFKELLSRTKEAIKNIPCDTPDFILEANRPFDAYCRLRSLFQGASKRVELFDPYSSADVFYRYLWEVDPSVDIVIVTSEHNLKGVVRADFISVSQLFAAQRPTTYTLIMNPNIHDRHLRLDNAICHLGGSIKDAGKRTPYTCTQQDATPATTTKLDDLRDNGTIWFSKTIGHRTS
ncbi:MAG: hypothetical protein WD063_03695 [Pirellulales bacterium]